MKILTLCIITLQLLYAAPSWIMDPSLNGKYIGAIGVAKLVNGDKVRQEKIALIKAKSALSHAYRLRIISTTHIEKNSTGYSSHQSDAILKSNNLLLPKILERYIDEKDVLYIWIVYDEEK